MAQVVTETTTTAVTPVEVTGTVTTFDPVNRAFIVNVPDQPAPVTYVYTAETQAVDETGTPVAWEVIQRGVPVTVHYTRAGDQLLVSRVVVRRQPAAVVEETTTTTTTTAE